MGHIYKRGKIWEVLANAIMSYQQRGTARRDKEAEG